MSRLCVLLCVVSIFSLKAQTQICEGNLGENIFTEGDFGSGAANILVPDPQIAPGYNYINNPPPNDGNYTVTNNTTSWGWFAADFWANIQDNSSDPNGYMMVVNASYEPGLFYEQLVEGLCENTLYVFTADVYNLITGFDLIKPNISFLLDGQVVYSSGDIPENEAWNTYGFTFTTGPDQTELTLSLQNNAPGGSGNDLAIDNISFRACGPEALILPDEIANICEDGSPIAIEATILGDQYENPSVQWQQSFDEGLTWEDIPAETELVYTHTDLSAGFYYYRYLLANGVANLANSKCRVVSNVKVIRVVPKFYTIIDTLCEGLSFELGENFYSETGIYEDSLLTDIGCDSIVTLDLTILPDTGINAAFDWNDPRCHDLEDGSIEVLDITNGYLPYTIWINDMPDSDGYLEGLGPGDYLYSITDRYGCTFEAVVNLQAPPPFVVDLGPDQQVGLGEMLQLNPFFSEPVQNLEWAPADLVNCAGDCSDLNWVPTNSSTFFLNAISMNGCLASDSINITVNTVRKVYIPNAFSPNDDGINDAFTIYGAEPNVQQIEELLVFDRWGGMVFQQESFAPNSLSAGWDGSFQGKEVPQGTYTYVAKIRFLDNAVLLYSDDVLLIR